MSDAVVTEAILDYYDTKNSAFAFYASLVPTVHTDKNDVLKEEGGSGPFIKTFVVEQEYEEVVAERKTTASTTSSGFESSGQLIFQVFIVQGFGDKDYFVGKKILDKLKRTFAKLYLPDGEGNFIKFGSTTPRQPINIARENKNRGYNSNELEQWRRLDLFIDWNYIANY